MGEVGIRALKQNASGVVRAVISGEVMTITDRGRAVAQMSPIAASRIAQLLDSGMAQPARHALTVLKMPVRPGQLSRALDETREDRF